MEKVILVEDNISDYLFLIYRHRYGFHRPDPYLWLTITDVVVYGIGDVSVTAKGGFEKNREIAGTRIRVQL